MAAKEIYDYFTGTVTADYTTAHLTLKARGDVKERSGYRQKKYDPDNGGRPTVITLSTTPVCYLDIPWGALSKEDSGTIYDFYMDSSKAYGMSRSFYYDHHDGHNYTVIFDNDVIERLQRIGNIDGISVTLRVLGVAP